VSDSRKVDAPLNIILYTNSFLPHVGGREIVVYHLAKALTELGHNVRVVCPGGWWSHRKYTYDFKVVRWPKIPGLSTIQSSRIQLAIEIARHRCDVISAHATYPAGYVALFNKSYTGTALVVTPHGEDIHVIPEIGHGLRLQPDLAEKIRQVMDVAEFKTAISDSVVASLLDAGATRESIVEIPNGVDFSRFDRDQGIDVRDRFNIPADKHVLLTVGNYVRRRGHEELVRAMAPISQARPDAHLVIVGRGTDVLQPLIDELGIGDQVTLTGGVPPVELNPTTEDLVAALYQASDVYVAPGMSEGSEGLSLALLDAMASGSAIVATRISGNRDVIIDDENGVLVEPGDPQAIADGVVRLLDEPELLVRCRERALSDVQTYSWTRIAEQYVETFRRAMVVSQQPNKAA